LELAIKRYDEMIKNIKKLKFTTNIENLITDSNTKNVFKQFTEELQRKENELVNNKLDFNYSDIRNIIILDKNYFINREKEVRVFLSIDEDGAGILGFLFRVIKEVSQKDNNNQPIDNLISAINTPEFETKKQAFNEVLSKVKSLKFIILNHEIKDNEKKYLGNGIITVNEKIIETLLKRIKDIEEIKNYSNLTKLFEITELLVTQKNLNNFNIIYTQENNIIKKVNPSTTQEIPEITQKINEYLNYKLPDDTLLNKLQNEDLFNKFKDINNYLISTISYSDANKKISDAHKVWKDLEPKLGGVFKSGEEKEKSIEETKKVLDNLKSFNNLFFVELSKYSNDNFNDISKFNPGDKNKNVESILSNELNKVKYFHDLKVFLKGINNPKNKKSEEFIDKALGNRVNEIKKLENYKNYLNDKKEGIYKPEDVNEKTLKDAKKEINKYFNTLKEIFEILKKIIIRSDDLKK